MDITLILNNNTTNDYENSNFEIGCKNNSFVIFSQNSDKYNDGRLIKYFQPQNKTPLVKLINNNTTPLFPCEIETKQETKPKTKQSKQKKSPKLQLNYNDIKIKEQSPPNQSQQHQNINNQYSYRYNKNKTTPLDDISNKIIEQLEIYYNQKPIDSLMFEPTTDEDIQHLYNLEDFYAYEIQRRIKELCGEPVEVQKPFPIPTHLVKNDTNEKSKKRVIEIVNEPQQQQQQPQQQQQHQQQQQQQHQQQQQYQPQEPQQLNKKPKLVNNSNQFKESNMNEIKSISKSLKKYFNCNQKQFQYHKLYKEIQGNPSTISNVLDILEGIQVITKIGNTDYYVWNGTSSDQFKKLIFNIYHSSSNFVVEEKNEFACQKCEDYFNLNKKYQSPIQIDQFNFPKKTQLCAISCQILKLLLSPKLRSNSDFLSLEQICENFFINNDQESYEQKYTVINSIYNIINVFCSIGIVSTNRDFSNQYIWSGCASSMECKSSCPRLFYRKNRIF
ncbi:hypothetical protein ACTFIV_007567 [Dictyostelium citrinum]